MIPDRLQYCLELFWIDQKRDQIWTLGPCIYHQNISKKLRKMMGTSLKSIISMSENHICEKLLKVRVPIFEIVNT